MATSPVEGWYPSPGKDGYLRWWDGSAWTDNEKPAPSPKETTPAAPTGKPVETTPKSKSNKRGAVTEIVGAAGLTAAGAALAADGAIGLGGKRKGFKGLGKYFVIGSILIIFGFFAVAGGTINAISGVDRVTAVGTVTKIMDGTGNQCIPTAEFEVNSKLHEVRASDFAKCTWQVGDLIDVSYEKNTDGLNAEVGEATTNGSTIMGGVIIGFIGFFVLAIGLIKLVLRAGSVAGGLLLMREGFRMGKGKSQPTAE